MLNFEYSASYFSIPFGLSSLLILNPFLRRLLASLNVLFKNSCSAKIAILSSGDNSFACYKFLYLILILHLKYMHYLICVPNLSRTFLVFFKILRPNVEELAFFVQSITYFHFLPPYLQTVPVVPTTFY